MTIPNGCASVGGLLCDQHGRRRGLQMEQQAPFENAAGRCQYHGQLLSLAHRRTGVGTLGAPQYGEERRGFFWHGELPVLSDDINVFKQTLKSAKRWLCLRLGPPGGLEMIRELYISLNSPAAESSYQLQVRVGPLEHGLPAEQIGPPLGVDQLHLPALPIHRSRLARADRLPRPKAVATHGSNQLLVIIEQTPQPAAQHQEAVEQPKADVPRTTHTGRPQLALHQLLRPNYRHAGRPDRCRPGPSRDSQTPRPPGKRSQDHFQHRRQRRPAPASLSKNRRRPRPARLGHRIIDSKRLARRRRGRHAQGESSGSGRHPRSFHARISPSAIGACLLVRAATFSRRGSTTNCDEPRLSLITFHSSLILCSPISLSHSSSKAAPSCGRS